MAAVAAAFLDAVLQLSLDLNGGSRFHLMQRNYMLGTTVLLFEAGWLSIHALYCACLPFGDTS